MNTCAAPMNGTLSKANLRDVVRIYLTIAVPIAAVVVMGGSAPGGRPSSLLAAQTGARIDWKPSEIGVLKQSIAKDRERIRWIEQQLVLRRSAEQRREFLIARRINQEAVDALEVELAPLP